MYIPYTYNIYIYDYLNNIYVYIYKLICIYIYILYIYIRQINFNHPWPSISCEPPPRPLHCSVGSENGHGRDGAQLLRRKVPVGKLHLSGAAEWGLNFTILSLGGINMYKPFPNGWFKKILSIK